MDLLILSFHTLVQRLATLQPAIPAELPPGPAPGKPGRLKCPVRQWTSRIGAGRQINCPEIQFLDS